MFKKRFFFDYDVVLNCSGPWLRGVQTVSRIHACVPGKGLGKKGEKYALAKQAKE